MRKRSVRAWFPGPSVFFEDLAQNWAIAEVPIRVVELEPVALVIAVEAADINPVPRLDLQLNNERRLLRQLILLSRARHDQICERWADRQARFEATVQKFRYKLRNQLAAQFEEF